MYNEFTTEDKSTVEGAPPRKTTKMTVARMVPWEKVIRIVPFTVPRVLYYGVALPLSVHPISPEAQINDGQFVVE